MLAFALDNKTTLLGEYARTDPQYEDQGIWGSLRSYVTMEMMKMYPSVERVHAASTDHALYKRSMQGYKSY